MKKTVKPILVLVLLFSFLLPGWGASFLVTEAAGCPPINEQLDPHYSYYPTPLAAAKYDKNGNLKIVDKNAKDFDIETGLRLCGAMGVVWDKENYYLKYPIGGDQIDRIVTYEQASYRSTSPNTYYYRTTKYYFIFAGENVFYAPPDNQNNIVPEKDIQIETFGTSFSTGADVEAFQAASSEEWDRLNNTNPYMYPDGTPKISYTGFSRKMILNNQPYYGYWVNGRNDVWRKIYDYSQLLDQEADYLVIAPAIMIYRTTKASKTDGTEVIGWVRPDKFTVMFDSNGRPDVQKTAQSAKNYILGDGMPA